MTESEVNKLVSVSPIIFGHAEVIEKTGVSVTIARFMAVSETARRFGQRLAFILDADERTQKDVAKQAGLSDGVISDYKSGRNFASGEAIDALAESFDLDVAEFFLPRDAKVPTFPRPSSGEHLAKPEVASHGTALARVLAGEAVSPHALYDAVLEVIQCLTKASARIKSAIDDREPVPARRRPTRRARGRSGPGRSPAARLKS